MIALAMVVSGVLLGCVGARGAFIPQLTRYTFGDRGPGVGDIKSKLPAALHAGLWLIAAYGLALVGCALFYRARAASRLGCHTANFVGAAVLVAVAANLSEDFILSFTVSEVRDTAWLRTAIAAAAVVKCCAFAVAAIGLIASIAILLRGATGALLTYGSKPKRWWDEVLAPPDRPAPPATEETLIENQQSWPRTPESVPGRQVIRCSCKL